MGILGTFASSFIVGFTGAVAPGPLLALVISETLRAGIIASLLIVAGHSLLEFAAVLGLAFGLGTALKGPAISAAIGAVGGTVMLLFAYLMISDAVKGPSTPHAVTGESRTRPPLKTSGWLGYLGLGAVISLSNPYWTIWWTTIGASLMDSAGRGGNAGTSAFYFGHILADFAWYIFVAALILTGNRALSNRTYRFLLAGCGLCLVLFGAYFLSDSLKRIFG